MKNKFCSTVAIILFIAGTLQAADLSSLTNRLVAADNHQRETAAAEAKALSLQDQQQIASRLIPLLKGTDTDRREYAAEALAKLGEAAEAAIPVLQANLSDDFPYVRIRSAEALAHIGAAALPSFIEALKNDNNEVRLVAVQALVHLGAQAKPAIPVLVLALDDKEGPIRQRAANALENLGADAAPKLIEKLNDPSFTNRVGLIRVLGSIDGTPASLPAQLTPFLFDPDPDVRLAAMKALAHKGQGAAAAVSEGLSSDKPLVRAESAEILADIGPDASVAVPLLISLLKDADARVRASSAHALGKMRDSASSAVPALREALNDTDRDVAARAQEALTAITVTFGGSHAPKDVYTPGVSQTPHHVTGATKPKPKPKPMAANHPSKKPVRPPKSPEKPLPVSYLTLNSTASIQALEMTAQKGTSDARSAAFAALTSLLQNPDDKLRSAAAGALGRVGTPEAKKILDPYLKQEELKKINRLIGEIETSTGSVKNAVDSLSSMGPAVVPAATKELRNPKATVRVAAIQILGRIGPAATPAVPRLIELLNDKEEIVRQESAKTLEAMHSPDAKNPLRWYYLKEKVRPYLKSLHIPI